MALGKDIVLYEKRVKQLSVECFWSIRHDGCYEKSTSGGSRTSSSEKAAAAAAAEAAAAAATTTTTAITRSISVAEEVM